MGETDHKEKHRLSNLLSMRRRRKRIKEIREAYRREYHRPIDVDVIDFLFINIGTLTDRDLVIIDSDTGPRIKQAKELGLNK